MPSWWSGLSWRLTPRTASVRRSRPNCQLTRGSDGSVGVGYAMLLAVVLVVVLAGAAMLGASVERALSRVSPDIYSPDRSTRSETRPAFDSAADSKRSIRDPLPIGTRPNYLLLGCLLLVGLPVATVAGWAIFRSPTKEPQEPEAKREPKKLVEEEVLCTRLNTKREVLWRQMLNDQDLVLKNRIEVRHVMTSDPITVRISTPGDQIAKLFAKHRVAHLAVCDDEHRMKGVVRLDAHRASPASVAGEIMTSAEGVLAPSSTVGAAIALLIEQGVSFLPVVDGETLCGVLTPTDLVLTLHCAMQLWFRVAETVQTNPQRVEKIELAARSIDESVGQLGDRVRELPQKVKVAIRTGNAAALQAELNETLHSVTRLMQQLDSARTQIRQYTSQVSDLKAPSPDETTGAASREELDQTLDRLLSGESDSKHPVSVILYVAEGYQRLKREEGSEAADDHLRSAIYHIAEQTDSSGFVARYSGDTLAIVLPDTGVADACRIGSRLSAGCGHSRTRPRLSIVSARRGETKQELLKRAEATLTIDSGDPDPELAAQASSSQRV